VERRVLTIVRNLPARFDHRAWLEREAPVSASYRVAIVCLKGSDDPAYEVTDAVE
jgi:hypothetical protein